MCSQPESYMAKQNHAPRKKNMHVMTQSLDGDDGFHLPHGLSVVNIYTKVISRSRRVAVVVKT